MTKVKDKVVVSFYDEEADLIVFEILCRLTRRRNFTNKIKDMLLEHIRATMPEMYEETINELNNANVETAVTEEKPTKNKKSFFE